MTSSPGEGYGQLKIDPTIVGWNPTATLIAMYYCASGFSWKTVSLLITVKTKNATLREYHVQAAVEQFLYQYKKYYNKDDNIFDLYQVRKKIAAYMRSNSIARDKRIPLWESLMKIERREWETMMGEGDRMEQRQCYGKEMTKEEVSEELKRGFLAMFNDSKD